mgnify:CR=1 FL=1
MSDELNPRELCIKKKFFSEVGANKFIDYIQARRKKNKNGKKCNIINSYKCAFCGFWHTTSKRKYR